MFSNNVMQVHEYYYCTFQLFLLEEQREKKFDHYARVIQKAFQKHFNQQKLQKQKEQASGKTSTL